MLIDLQLHSTYSDGYLTPTQVVEFIKGQGVRAAALTDHNTVGGLDEFRLACQKHNIKPITGLEIYAKMHHRRFNILWYNFNDNNPELHKILRESQVRRRRQVRILLKKIVKRGLKLDINKTLDKYNHYVPVNRVVDDLAAVRGNLRKIKNKLGVSKPREGEILAEYFHNKKYGVLKNSYIDIDKIIKLRKKIGGYLVLCHPAKSGYVSRDFLKELKFFGIDGIEVLSPHHPYGAVVYLQQLTYEHDFIGTGGSDFHRFEGGSYPVQDSWQYYRVDSEMLRGVGKIIGK